MTKSARAVFATVVINLCAFIFITSLPAFQDLPHHWIFPVLGAAFAAEWGLAAWLRAGALPEESFDRQAARSAVLWLLAFLMAMGIVRHQTILACIDRCAFKLAGAAAIAAAVFCLQARLRDRTFWSARRAQAAALGCAFWAVFLSLHGFRAPAWVQDAVVLGGAAALAPLRTSPAVRTLLLAVVPALIARRLLGERGLILFGLALACGGLWFSGRKA